MANFSIGAINRSKWVLLALVFLIAQIIPIIQFNGTAKAADTGFKNGSNFSGNTSAPSGDANWSNASGAQTSDSSRATVQIQNSSDVSNYLRVTGYGFAIPAGATIDGISVQIDRSEAGESSSSIQDNVISLVKNNVVTGTNKAVTNSNWPSTDTTVTYGGSTDNWGSTWTVADINNANFGVVTSVKRNGNNNNDESARVNAVTVKVYYTEPIEIVTNPTLATACGLDIALVIDNSTSISNTEMSQMKTALKAFTSALAGTPTEFSVTKFASTATVEQNFTSNTTAVNNAIDGVPTGGGFTNWEDGLIKANSTFPNRAGNPDLIVFATDGDPTTSNTVGGTDTNQPNAHLDPAITVANTIKTSNKRILSIGIGLGGSSLTRLQQISGPVTDNGNILTSDVITSDFTTLAADLAEFASQTCGGTVTTTKLIDADGNANTTNDRTPAANWTFDINGGSNPAATSTNAQGLTPAVKVDAGSGYSVNETQQQGYTLLSASCTGATVNGTKNGNAVTGLTIAANNIVSCTFINARTNGTINVVKNLDNSDGGTKQKSDFSFIVNGQTYQFEQDGTNTVTVPTGTYTVTEVNPNTAGYTTTYSNCTDIVVTENTSPTCTIYNNDNSPSITLNKVVEGPTYGVTPDLNGFGLSVGGTNVNSGTTTNVKANQAIVLNEQGANGYEFVRIEGNAKCPSVLGGTVTLALGESITCTIVNKAKATSLTVTKHAINDNGGTYLATDFSLYINDVLLDDARKGGGDVYDSSVTYLHSNAPDGDHTLVGDYTLSEDNENGYEPTDWTCTGNSTPLNSATVTVKLGEDVRCEITNDDEAPVLTLIKSLNPQLWGSGASGSDFTLKATEVGASTPAVSGSDTNAFDTTSTVKSDDTFQASNYTLSETSTFNASTYSASDWSCLINGSNTPTLLVGGVITLGLADNAVCTITNEMKPATLIVEKVVKNDNGGTAKVTDYSYKINQGTSTYFDADGTVTNTLNKGIYSVVEDQANTGGYTTTYSGDCTNVSIDNGQTKTCTITNDDVAPKLTLTKITPNDNGGNLEPSQVELFATGPSPATTATQFTSGDTKDVSAGTYVVSETPVPGYEASKWTGDCASDGSITLNPGGVYSCSITNDDLPNTLTVKKIVKNDNGGTMTAEQFSFSVNGGPNVTFNQDLNNSLLGENEVSLNSGTYTITEPTVPSGYEVSYDGCTNIVFTLDQNATCTITNDDKPATVVVHKTVINDNGGGKQSSNFTMYVEGTNVSTTGFPGSANGTAVMLDAGSYSVSEDQQYGYKMTTTGDCSGTIANGETKHCYVTNNDIAPKITIHKSIPDDYPTDQEFEFDVTKSCVCEAEVDSSCGCPSKATVTEVEADNGYYQTFEVSDLSAGLWNVEEEVPDGWELVGFYCTPVNRYDFFPQSTILNDTQDSDEGTKVQLGVGDEYVCYFYNQPLGTVTVTKYHDKNENGVRDDYFGTEEPLLAGFTFNLYTEEYDYEDGWKTVLVDTKVSDQNGNVTFENVPSSFYWIEEAEQDGWKLTSLVCDGDPDPKYDEITRLFSNESPDENVFYVEPGSQADCYAGNASTKYYYDIAKSNNATTAKRVGDVVTYTITLTIPEDTGVLHNPRVGDAPPTGFKYLSGSWTANSSLRGNLKSTVVIEPTYASPGVWNFGDGFDEYYESETPGAPAIPNNAFYPGEVITLTYQTKIESNVTPGTYPDKALSIAFNTSDEEDQNQETVVIANVQDEGDSPFVGTQVVVVTDTVPPTLVNTGSGALWALVMGAALIVGGFSTRRITATERRMK